ncbi:MAG: cupin, partial [Propionibacteriaceae bacterium]
MKDEREFYPAAEVEWADDPSSPGVSQRVLSADGPVILTRLARWAPGLDTTASGVIRHTYVEEVYLLEGALTDLTLDQTF